MSQHGYAALDWVDWVNNRRLLEPLGNIPPAEAEANVSAAVEKSDMAASLRQISLRHTRSGSVPRDREDSFAPELGKTGQT